MEVIVDSCHHLWYTKGSIIRKEVNMSDVSKEQAVLDAIRILRSQGGSPSRVVVEALVTDLLEGGTPKTYGERMVQMELQLQGYSLGKKEIK